jgi:hypothetical protein
MTPGRPCIIWAADSQLAVAEEADILTKLAEMCSKPDQCFALNQCFRNAQCNCKTISGACTSAKLVNDRQTVLVNVSAQNYQYPPTNSEFPMTYLKIKAVSLISDANVEILASILSSMETRANN